jgi:hypothetical protein
MSLSCLVQITSRSSVQRLFWDGEEPLECSFPELFCLQRENQKLIIQHQETQDVQEFEIKDSQDCYEWDFADYQLALFFYHPDARDLIKEVAAEDTQIMLIQLFGGIFQNITSLKKNFLVRTEGVSLFQVKLAEEGFEIHVFFDDLELFFESGRHQKLSLGEQLHFTSEEIKKVRIGYNGLSWIFSSLAFFSDQSLKLDAFLEKDQLIDTQAVFDKKIAKGALGWCFALALMFLPLFWVLRFFDSQPQRLKNVAQVELPRQSSHVEPVILKPIIPALVVKPKPLVKKKKKSVILKPKKAPVKKPVQKIRLQDKKKAPAHPLVHLAPKPSQVAPKVVRPSIKEVFHKKFAATSPAPSSAVAPRHFLNKPTEQKNQALSALSFLSKKPSFHPPAQGGAALPMRHFGANARQVSQMTQLSALKSKTFGAASSLDTTQSIESYSGAAQRAASGIGKAKFFNQVQGKVSASQLAKGFRLSSSQMSLSGKGHASESAILRALSSHMAAFEYCYEKALLTHAALSGEVLLRWGIASNGTVKAVQVIRSEIHHQGLMDCLSSEIKKIHFPSPQGGEVSVEYPFSFSSHKL